MEIESTNHQDVAEPDQIASGIAGTGHEYQNRNGIFGVAQRNSAQRSSKNSDEFFSSSGFFGTTQTSKNRCEFFSSIGSTRPFQLRKQDQEIIGLGVLYNGTMNPAKVPGPADAPGMAAWPDLPESLGDLIPSSSGREEGIADRLNRKIERSGRRLETMEERRKTRAAGRATIRKGVWR